MPLSKVTYPFPIDGDVHHIFAGASLDHWKKAAMRNGFTLLGRAKDRLHVVLGCKRCADPTYLT